MKAISTKQLLVCLALILIGGGFLLWLTSGGGSTPSQQSTTPPTNKQPITQPSSSESPGSQQVAPEPLDEQQVGSPTATTIDKKPTISPPSPKLPATAIKESEPSTPPVAISLLHLTQNNADVSASGQGLADFAYFITEVEPDCSDQNSSATYTTGQSAINLADNQWVCFRAQDSNNQDHYAVILVDLEAPTVTISQFKNNINIDVQIFNQASVASDTWQKIITSSDTEPDCDSQDFQNPNRSTAGKDINIDKTDNNKWLCYRVSNSLGVYGYDKYQLDYNAPTITISVSEDGQTLTASTTADDLPAQPAWKKSGPNDSSSCGPSTDFTAGNVISGIVSNKYYCFSVADQAGNEDFAEFFTAQQTSPAPRPNPGPQYRLAIKQDGLVVKVDTARSINISGFAIKYFISQSTDDPNCSASNTTATYQDYDDSTHVAVATDERWVCFKATKGTQELFTKIQVDLKKPVIEVDRDQYVLTATATSTSSATIVSNSWENFKATTTTGPNCQALSNSALYSNPHVNNKRVAITSSTKWVCFRVKTSKGVAGYKRHQLPTLPTISTSQKLTSIKTTVTSTATGAVVDLDDSDFFGQSIAFDGNYLAVGAPYDDGYSTTTINSQTVSETGAVYIFKRIGTVWFLEQKIADVETGFTDLEPKDHFGSAVVMEDDWLIVGAPGDNGHSTTTTAGGDTISETGAIYIFKRENTGWEKKQVFSDDDNDTNPKLPELEPQERFGTHLALDGGWLAVGVPKDDGWTSPNQSASSTGAVYTFQLDTSNSTWVKKQTIQDQKNTGFTVLKYGDNFGTSVSLNAGYLAVGAPKTDGYDTSNNAINNVGAAYVFKLNTSNSTQPWGENPDQRITHGASTTNSLPELKAHDNFGWSVSISGDRLVVGAPGDDKYAPPNFSSLNAWATGAVYIFERQDDTKKWINNNKKVIDANTKLGNPKRSLGLQQEDNLGHEVSLTSDYLVVSAVSDDSLGDGRRGSVFILQKDGVNWVVKQKASDLQAGFSDLELGDNFGYSIFLKGDRLAVGAPPRDGDSDIGAAYILSPDKNNIWAVKQKLGEELVDENSWQTYKKTASTAPACDSSHTYSTANIFEKHPTVNSTHKWICIRVKTMAGIYIYKKLELKPTWDIVVSQTQTQVSARVAATNPKIDASDQFGYRVAMDGDYLAISAPGDDNTEPNSNSGAVYIYKRHGFTWILEAEILGAGGMKTFTGAGGSSETHYASISLDGDRLAIGMPYRTDYNAYTGAAWIYKRFGTEWVKEHMIIDTESGDFTALEQYDYFGTSVSLDGDRLAIGAPGDNNSATVTDTGAVYIFKRSSTGWGATPEKVYVKDSNFTNLNANDKFGTSVSLDGDRLAVGAPYDDSSAGNDTGAVYIFKRSSTAWGDDSRESL